MHTADIGVYGLGTMGSALALNMAEKGFNVAVTNRETDWIAEFVKEAGSLSTNLVPNSELTDFVASLKTPRVVLFMIPSGKPMDDMIAQISPLLEAGDTIIDGGNADFNETRRRSAELAERDLHFVGMGVSGGEEGARKGPSIMVGGTPHSWQQLRPMVEAIAAQFEGSPCVDHLGTDGAGHFVKTVHNGIEYADMQMLAEIYGLLAKGEGRSAEQIGDMFATWNEGTLQSFLVEASAAALKSVDAATGKPMVDVILDKAGQKGTGRWTVIEALKLGVSASAIEGAVGARIWSAAKDTRMTAESTFGNTTQAIDFPSDLDLAKAMEAARIISHVQGFEVLRAASDTFDWNLPMARIAEIWRAGCIIRSKLLDDLAAAFREELPHDNLLLAPSLVARLQDCVPSLRRVAAAGVLGGYAMPSFVGAIEWFDSMTHGRGTANLIQAQRDFFGMHGFERLDQEGKHHGDWLREI